MVVACSSIPQSLNPFARSLSPSPSAPFPVSHPSAPPWLRPFAPTLLGALGVALILAPALLYPYGRDQAVFAYMGRVIADGGMPYRDAWDLKPPGIYLLYALVALLTPDSPGQAMMVALRWVDLAIVLVTGWLLGRLLLRLTHTSVDASGHFPGERWAAPIAAAWYAALYLQGTYWSAAQAEAWANPLLLVAALLSLRVHEDARPKNRAVLTIGLLAGGTALLKPTSLAPMLPFLALAVWQERRPVWSRLFLLLAGSSIPLALAAVWLAVGGALDDYLDVQRGFVAPYAGLNAPTLMKRLENLGGWTGGWLLAIALPALLGVAGWLLRSEWRDGRRWLVGAATVAGLCAVWVQNKYFGYHWQTVLPGLSLLAAVGTAAAMRAAGARGAGIGVAGVLLAGGWSYLSRPAEYQMAAARLQGTISERQWLARFGVPNGGDYSFLADFRAARHVRAETAPDDRVMVWGMEPAVHLLADRRPPGRFFFNVPVAAPFAPAAWRQEFLNDLDAHPPRLVLVLRNDFIPWATGTPTDSSTQMRQWPTLQSWLSTHYERETEIEDFAIYSRREARPDASRDVKAEGNPKP